MNTVQIAAVLLLLALALVGLRGPLPGPPVKIPERVDTVTPLRARRAGSGVMPRNPNKESPRKR